MKLVTYSRAGESRFGAIVRDRIVDLADGSRHYGATDMAIAAIPSRIDDFLPRSSELGASAQSVVDHFTADPSPPVSLSSDLHACKLLPPVPRPTKIICVARNYAEHAKEAGMDLPTLPILFARFNSTLVADGDPVRVPTVSNNLDWEGELAVIIGRDTNGKRISKTEAMDYVFGYSIFNDVTVRDYQFRVTQYTAGKNFRSSGPFGPVLVTADEIDDPHNLDIRTTLNGKVEQFANTSTMIFDIPTILEHIAEFIDLEAGDVIPTGTPAGVGFKRQPPVFLKDGDVVSVEISGIGVLSNPVRNEGAD